MIWSVESLLVSLALVIVAYLFVRQWIPKGTGKLLALPFLVGKALVWDSPSGAKGPAFAFAVLLFLVAFGFLCAALIVAGQIGLFALTFLAAAFIYNWRSVGLQSPSVALQALPEARNGLSARRGHLQPSVARCPPSGGCFEPVPS